MLELNLVCNSQIQKNPRMLTEQNVNNLCDIEYIGRHGCILEFVEQGEVYNFYRMWIKLQVNDDMLVVSLMLPADGARWPRLGTAFGPPRTLVVLMVFANILMIEQQQAVLTKLLYLVCKWVNHSREPPWWSHSQLEITHGSLRRAYWSWIENISLLILKTILPRKPIYHILSWGC